jgi:WD40 repeat protein
VLVENRTGEGTRLSVQPRSAEPVMFFPFPAGAALVWDDGAVSLFDSTGRQTQVLDAHRVEVDAVVVAPNGSWAATADGSGVVTVWDVERASGTWSPRENLPGLEGKTRLSIAPDSSTLVSVSGDGTAVVWDLSDDAGLATPSPGLGSRGWISNTPAEVVPGRLLVAPTRDGPAGAPYWAQNRVSATFLDPRTWSVVDQVPVGRNLGVLMGSSVSVSPDRSLVAVTHQVGTVVLDARTREEVARIELPEMKAFGERVPENVWCTGWTPDGSKLLLCAEGEEYDAEDGNLVVVDTTTWEVADERVDVGGSVQSIETSPDGKLIALGMVLQIVDDAPPGTVKILDAQSLEVVQEADLGTDQYPFDVTFSPDGRRLAVGVDSGMVLVADVASGELVGEPVSAHSASVGQVEWLPDNRTVVSTGFDTNATLYDADRGLVRATMPVATDVDDAHTYLLSVDRDSLTATAREKPGRGYPLDPQAWLDRACQVAGRDLTREEWSSYLPDRPYERTCTGRG